MTGFLRPAGRFLFGKLMPRRPYRVLTGPLKGARFILGSMSGEGAGGSVYFNKIEVEQTSAMVREIQSGDTFFDVGANVGYYTVLASRRVGPDGHVAAFEPVVRNVAFLQQHTVLNDARNVEILPLAISAETGFSSFAAGPHDSMGKLDANGNGEMLVATVTLDEIAERINKMPDVIKIDVEGAEMDVFRGAVRILNEKRPKIFLSTHSTKLRTECLDHLRGLGYTVEDLIKSDDPHEFFLKYRKP